MALVIRTPGIRNEFVAFAFIVVGVTVDLLHSLVSHLLKNLRLLLLLRAQTLHELKTQVSLFVENLGTLPFASVDDVGFGAGEGRTHYDLRSFEETCNVEMVA